MYKIKVHKTWVEVSEWIFRSWGGERKLNGKAYNGPIYFLGTDVQVRR